MGLSCKVECFHGERRPSGLTKRPAEEGRWDAATVAPSSFSRLFWELTFVLKINSSFFRFFSTPPQLTWTFEILKILHSFLFGKVLTFNICLTLLFYHNRLKINFITYTVKLVHLKLHFSPQFDRYIFWKLKSWFISAPVRLIDGLTPDLSLSVSNRFSFLTNSIGQLTWR